MGILDWFRGKKSFQSVHNAEQTFTSLFVQEPYSGAWQKNDELTREDLVASYAVFACVSLISKDIGKLPILLKRKKQGVLVGVDVPEKLRVLKKPNNYQTWQQFQEQWTSSLLLRGNTYVWKLRDVFGDVYRMVVLNPDLVYPLVDDNGNVFYQFNTDRLTQTESVIVPASEIIHDRINAFYHPLVGLSPIVACGIAAGMGVKIIKNGSSFFGNGSRPGGILVAPGSITKEKAEEIQTRWNQNYTGANFGKTAVIGDGMTYIPLGISAADSQMIEQLGVTARIVCTAFNVPPFKVGVVDVQGTTNVENLNEIYYSDCLQALIEARENLLDEGLDLPSFKVEAFLDLGALIRMNQSSKMAYLKEGVSAGLIAPNEGRAELGMLPVEGGNSPMIQQQNYSLEALAKRDAKEDPFNTSSSAAQATETSKPDEEQPEGENALKSLWKGVFKDDVAYKKGEFVTKNGSLWHVEKDHLGEFDHKNFKLCAKEWTE